MHRAPAVNHNVGRSRWHVVCLVVLGVASLAFALVFAFRQSPADWRVTVVLLTALLVPVPGILGWIHAPVGQLRWDGLQWYWSEFRFSGSCRLSLLMDWQNVMLVRVLAVDHRPVWLWLESSADRRHWLAVRRAIVSSQHGADEIDGTDKVASGEAT